MNGRLDIFYEWKTIEKNAYVPITIALSLIGYSYLRKNALSHIIPALEFTFPVFAAWWSIFLFQDILEEPGGETVFSYPIRRWQIGIIRVGVFFILFLILMIVMLLIIDQICTENIFIPLALQLGTEAFFFSGLGFLAMTITLNTGWSLVIVTIYSSTQILTRGQLLPIINIYAFNDKILSYSELLPLTAISLFLGVVLWLLAQLILNRIQQYN